MAFYQPNLQGSNPYLQGASSNLQGSSPSFQGSSPAIQGPSYGPYPSSYGPFRPSYGPALPSSNNIFASVPSSNSQTSNSQTSNSPTPSNLYGNGIQTSPTATNVGTAAPAVKSPRNASFDGKAYDLNNDDQSRQYYNDVINHVTSQTNNAYNQNKQNLVNSQGLALGGLNQQQSKLNSDNSNYLRDNNNQGINFNNDYNSGNAARSQSAFGGGNVFQSGASQGQGYADNQHLRGLADLQAGASQYQNQYNQANTQLGLQRNQFNNSYDQGIYALDKQRADSINSAKDQLSSNLGYYDVRNNPNTTIQDFSSKFSLTPYTAPTAPQVDLGNVNPFASSSTLGQSPTAVGASNFLASPNSNLSSQDQYYGYNTNGQDKNYINNYFKTGNPNQ